MAAHRKFLESHQIETLAVPLNTTGAAVASDWISLKTAAGVVFVIIQGAWAGGTPAVTLAQATAVAGTGTKALGFTEAYGKTALVSEQWVAITVAANTFNLTATANEITVIEVGADQLDRDGNFDCVQLNIESPGANADLIACLAILYGVRDQGSPASILKAATVD